MIYDNKSEFDQNPTISNPFWIHRFKSNHFKSNASYVQLLNEITWL